MDQLKERIRTAIWNAGICNRFVTATEMVREFHLESRDPVRFLKKRIEQLRNEECPIVGLPGGQGSRGQGFKESSDGLGPGYTWVHDPGSEWGRAVIARFDLDIGSRIREMVKHRAVLTRMTVTEAQMQLFGAGEKPQMDTDEHRLVGADVSDDEAERMKAEG